MECFTYDFFLFLTTCQLLLLTEFEDRLESAASTSRPLNTITTPLSSVSYEDDFDSSPGSGTLTEKKSALEPE